MTRAHRRAVGVATVVALGASLGLTHATPGWAGWTDRANVTGTTIGTHAVLPPTSVSCTGGGLLAPLTFSWPSKDPRYTYRAELVDSTGTVRRTDTVPESGQGSYSVTYAVDAMPLGSFTVRVSSSLTASTTWTSPTAAPASGSKTVLLLGLTSSCG